MKNFKLLTFLLILFVGFNLDSFAQETLPPVTVASVNYKYLRSVYDNGAAQPVRLLEHHAASYDVKDSEYYDDEYEGYSISFYLPNGQVLAAYDKDGKLLRTAERYKNVAVPPAVRTAISNKYPNWSLTKDIYLVNYYGDNSPRKLYKLVLENGSKRIRVKSNEAGDFIEK
jgi:hypothetical protein